MQIRFPRDWVWINSPGGGKFFTSPSIVVNVGAVMGRTRGAHSARITSGTRSRADGPSGQVWWIEGPGELGWSPNVTFGLVAAQMVSDSAHWKWQEKGTCIGGLGIDPLYNPVARISVTTSTGSRKTSRRQDCGRFCRAVMRRARANARMAQGRRGETGRERKAVGRCDGGRDRQKGRLGVLRSSRDQDNLIDGISTFATRVDKTGRGKEERSLGREN
jgi:hypothetical protein